jgi:hypothetical protein
MTHLAIDSYKADLIIPLDDDEIICPKTTAFSPYRIREALNSLDQHCLYTIPWRIYFPMTTDNTSEINVASRMRYCIGDEPDTLCKIIIPSGIVTDDFIIAFGNHTAYGTAIQKTLSIPELCLAHFPIRSSEQLASKAIIGWLNTIQIPGRDDAISSHWREMFQTIKKGSLPTVKQMQFMCCLYRSDPADDTHFKIMQMPLSLPPQCFEIRYTSLNEVNVLHNLCDNAERIAYKCASLSRHNDKPDS